MLIACSASEHKTEDKVSVESTSQVDSLQNGDIIFQTSKSSQSKAIQLATNSKYSHMGLIYQQGNGYVVYEAIQPVKVTPLKEWIARGENGHYVVKRLKNADQILTPEVLTKMKSVGNEYLNKDYDIYFEWSDDKIYCSELVWKIYQRSTGIEIGQLDKLNSFDLSNSVVKEKIEERYGSDIPMDEIVISPSAMFDSDNLVAVSGN
jgi:uncharacterized protein YycO